MKASHFYKISYTILYVLLALILIVVALFFGLGYDNPIGEVNWPVNTDWLLGLVYGMLVMAVLVTAGAVAKQLVCVWKQNRKRAYRLFAGIGLFIMLMLVVFFCSSSLPMQVGGEAYTSVLWLKVADMLLYAIYVLLALALLLVILSVLGIWKHFHFKR